jgi:hypothetical protein
MSDWLEEEIDSAEYLFINYERSKVNYFFL